MDLMVPTTPRIAAAGPQVISFSEGLDFSTASGKLFYTLIIVLCRVREERHRGASSGRLEECPEQRHQTGKTTSDGGRLQDCYPALTGSLVAHDFRYLGNQHQNGPKGHPKPRGINLIAADAVTPMDSIAV
jgi:hypothetical protein